MQEMSTATEALDTRAEQQAKGLEALAALIRANPDLAEHLAWPLRQMQGYVNADEDPKAVLGAFARAGAKVGRVEKDYSIGGYMHVRIHTGGIAVALFSDRAAVCERVVVGTKTETKTVKDPAALALVPEVEVTEEVEVVEWVCSPLLEVAS